MQNTGFNFLSLFGATKTQMSSQGLQVQSGQKGSIKNGFKFLFSQMLGKNSPASSALQNKTMAQTNSKLNEKDSIGLLGIGNPYLVQGHLVQVQPQIQSKIKGIESKGIRVKIDDLKIIGKANAENQNGVVVLKDKVASEGTSFQGEVTTGKGIQKNQENIKLNKNSKSVDDKTAVTANMKQTVDSDPSIQNSMKPEQGELQIEGMQENLNQVVTSSKTNKKTTLIDKNTKTVNEFDASVNMKDADLTQKSKAASPQILANLKNEKESNESAKASPGQKSQSPSFAKEMSQKQATENLGSDLKLKTQTQTQAVSGNMKTAQMQSQFVVSKINSDHKKSDGNTKDNDGKKQTVDIKATAMSTDEPKISMISRNRHEARVTDIKTDEKMYSQNLAEKTGQSKFEVQTEIQNSGDDTKGSNVLQIKTESNEGQLNVASKAGSESVESMGQRPSIQGTNSNTPIGEKFSGSTLLREPMAEQIAPAMARMIQGRQPKLTLSLKPNELGSLKIELSSQQGTLGAKFLVESQEIRQLVEASLPELKSMLERQGIQVEAVEVQVRANSEDGQSAQARFARNNQGNTSGQSNQHRNHTDSDQTQEETQHHQQPMQYGYNSVEYIA